jgi:uncharacterized membrane protein YkgB
MHYRCGIRLRHGTNFNPKKNKMNTNTKGTLLAIGIMLVIIVIGLIYGVQLEKSFYISNTY